MHQEPKYKFSPIDSILLVVDPQIAFGKIVPVPHIDNALEKVKSAISAWKGKGGRVYITRHVFSSPDEVGRVSDFIPKIGEILTEDSPYSKFYDGIEGDVIVNKTRFNALVGTSLERDLKSKNIKTVVVCGFTTPICVQGTVDGLAMADFQVVLLNDACASQPFGNLSAEAAHDTAIERMKYLFANVIDTEEFIKN